jgi:hypothetical protein
MKHHEKYLDGSIGDDETKALILSAYSDGTARYLIRSKSHMRAPRVVRSARLTEAAIAYSSPASVDHLITQAWAALHTPYTPHTTLRSVFNSKYNIASSLI